MSEHTLIERALLLDQWLETMRGPDGYGGPVAHWWQNSLYYTGAGLDWRYEGIITAYLMLFEKTGDAVWLARARQAGDDLVRGQLPSGNFRHSRFELNPYAGGNPHESGADIGMLRLAETLKAREDDGWQAYADAACRNLREIHMKLLWRDDTQRFYDNLDRTSFVPNKAATLTEALFLYARVCDDETAITRYALPTLDAIIEHQITEGELRGAILQASDNGRPVHWYFPYYVARCIPALLLGYAWNQQQRYLHAARLASEFILKWQDPDGGFVQIVYPKRRYNRYQRWVAGNGDTLRALRLMRPYGVEADLTRSHDWLISQQESMGGYPTAEGFASQINQRKPGKLPEFRDLLPVCGWTDKAFRYIVDCLPDKVSLPSEPPAQQPVEAACTIRGRHAHYKEDTSTIELKHGRRVLYRWRKGEDWAEVQSDLMLWK
ncbi:MAG: hypothetical protein ACOCX5_01730 [Chloroflexota bacterium]